MSKPPNRRPQVSIEIANFIVSVGFDPKTNKPCEVFFVGRGKVGHQLDKILYDLGVSASQLMQGEDMVISEPIAQKASA